MDMHVERVCKRSGPSVIKRCGHIEFSAENVRILGSCSYLLSSSVGSAFCVIFYLRFAVGRSVLRTFRETFHGRTCLEVLAVASFRQQ